MTRVTLILIILFMGAVGVTMSIVWPSVLAENVFLKNFVNHEILSLLVVVLTITFASVANIHLTISQTQTKIEDAQERKRIEEQFAKPLRRETASSAWLLFWAFVVCFLAVLVKGQFGEVERAVSAVHAVALIVIFINAAVLYDIYGAVFALVGVEEQK